MSRVQRSLALRLRGTHWRTKRKLRSGSQRNFSRSTLVSAIFQAFDVTEIEMRELNQPVGSHFVATFATTGFKNSAASSRLRWPPASCVQSGSICKRVGNMAAHLLQTQRSKSSPTCSSSPNRDSRPRDLLSFAAAGFLQSAIRGWREETVVRVPWRQVGHWSSNVITRHSRDKY